MLNVALDLYDKSFETIEGEKFMSPSPSVNHSLVTMRVGEAISRRLIPTNKGYALPEVDVHFPDGNLFKPDLIVVSFENRHIMMNRRNIIQGVPDMTVEILSRSTMKRDTTIKKDIYERNGVKEYWIIDPYRKSIEVFILKDGKYNEGAEYVYFDNEEWEELTEDEKINFPQEITVSIFEDLNVKLADVFGWCI